MIYINALVYEILYDLIMIRLLSQGEYTLNETKTFHKILSLEDMGTYGWIYVPKGFYEILVASQMKDGTDHKLAAGKYRLYGVKNEQKLTDLAHLELLVGEGVWQGYLLPTGLPGGDKKRNRIIPTNEIITKSTH